MTRAELASPTVAAVHLAGPGGDRSVWYSGWLLTFLATGEETNGQFALIEEIGRKGQSVVPPPHVHTREDECFFVVEGAITCYVGDETVHVPAGSFVLLPRGVPHRYELVSEEVRLLNLCVPAGFEGVFRALSEPAAALTLPPAPDGPPDIPQLLAAAADHGVEILIPPPDAGR